MRGRAARAGASAGSSAARSLPAPRRPPGWDSPGPDRGLHREARPGSSWPSLIAGYQPGTAQRPHSHGPGDPEGTSHPQVTSWRGKHTPETQGHWPELPGRRVRSASGPCAFPAWRLGEPAAASEPRVAGPLLAHSPRLPPPHCAELKPCLPQPHQGGRKTYTNQKTRSTQRKA